MTPYHKRVTAFTKRMAEDMQLRNLSPRTIDAYTYHVDRFALRFGKHPEQLGPYEIREFQLWMINELKSSSGSIAASLAGMRKWSTTSVVIETAPTVPEPSDEIGSIRPGSLSLLESPTSKSSLRFPRNSLR
jgi:hypothetical protein